MTRNQKKKKKMATRQQVSRFSRPSGETFYFLSSSRSLGDLQHLYCFTVGSTLESTFRILATRELIVFLSSPHFLSPVAEPAYGKSSWYAVFVNSGVLRLPPNFGPPDALRKRYTGTFCLLSP